MRFNYDGEILTIEELYEVYEDECYYQSTFSRREPKFFELLANLEEVGLLTVVDY